MSQITLADARRITAAAEKKAAEIGQAMNIAVADEGGNIVSHIRMDGAWIGSIDISQKVYRSAPPVMICDQDVRSLLALLVSILIALLTGGESNSVFLREKSFFELHSHGRPPQSSRWALGRGLSSFVGRMYSSPVAA
jgi:hypothetical protein